LGYLLKVVSNCLSQFFDHPLNSFIHNSLLLLIKTSAKRSEVIEQIVELTSLGQIIINTYKRKKQIQAMYWGHLKEISSIINPYVKRSHEWDYYVMNQVKEIDYQIIQPTRMYYNHRADTKKSLFPYLMRNAPRRIVFIWVFVFVLLFFLYMFLFI